MDSDVEAHSGGVKNPAEASVRKVHLSRYELDACELSILLQSGASKYRITLEDAVREIREMLCDYKRKVYPPEKVARSKSRFVL